MGRQVCDDRKAKVTPGYNQLMWNTISKCTTRQTLNQMGYSSRKPYQVSVPSAKYRKRDKIHTGSPKLDTIRKHCLTI